MQNFRDFSFLKENITGLPENYENIKEGILTEVKNNLTNGNQPEKFERSIYDRILGLIVEGWKRKDIFFLVRDLVEHNDDVYQDFDTFLLEIDSLLTGNCDTGGVLPFEDEKDMQRPVLVNYISSFGWIK